MDRVVGAVEVFGVDFFFMHNAFWRHFWTAAGRHEGKGSELKAKKVALMRNFVAR